MNGQEARNDASMSDVNHGEGADQGLRRDELLDALDHEIAAARTRSSAAGWTEWALYLAIGAALWLLLDTLEESRFSAFRSAAVFLSVWLLLAACTSLLSINKRNKTIFRFGSRILSSTELGFARSHLLYSIVINVCALVVSLSLREQVHWIITVSALVFLSLESLGGAMILVLTFVDIPIPLRYICEIVNSRGYQLWPLACLMTCIIAIVGYAYCIFTSTSGLPIADLRIGGLFSVIAWLVLQLTSAVSDPSPLVSRLEHVRRELAFGRIAIAPALQEADIATAGTKTENYLQRYVDAFLETVDRLREQLQVEGECFDGAVEAYELTGRESSNASPAGDSQEFMRRFAVCNEELEQLSKKANDEMSKFATRASLITALDEEACGGVAALQSKMEEALSQVLSIEKELSAKANTFLERLNQEE